MMKYKISPYSSEGERGRSIVVDEGAPENGKTVTPNLEGQELLISQLVADCPMGEKCITKQDGILSSICDDLSGFGLPDLVYCSHDDEQIEAVLLSPDGCPDSLDDCLNCEFLITVKTYPVPEKSHCYVVCDKA